MTIAPQDQTTYAEAAESYGWKIAEYKPQPLPEHQGNGCIEALELSLDPLEVKCVLEYLPKVHEDASTMKDNVRLQILMGLTNFMLPLTCHLQASVAVDAMMRQGYVGRTARSPQHIRIFHRVAQYARDEAFRQRHDSICAQSSAALIGVSGMGKTSTLRRFLARQSQVIYHPANDVAQVTWLHVKMVSEVPGVKGLCERIIKAIDDLFPFKKYYRTYVGSGRASASALIHHAGFLMNAHLVGLLIVDELQNLRTKSGDNPVMSELASLCDLTEVPILFVTTPKAKRILTEAARQMRRSLNMGFGNWNRLPAFDTCFDSEGQRRTLNGEWVEIARELWKHCVLRKKRKLDDSMLSVLYECSQGIIDLTIKLFIVSEWTAILSGEEELSESLVRDVYQTYMTVLHPLIEAYKRNDTAALLKL
ncbi:MAG: ATP-binding protein, partial [Proteobacteria bacterium]|nr:ATP-binding protein [Pseudomonadota bacterium]